MSLSVLSLVACGDDEGPDGPEPLPAKPQLVTNGVIFAFPVTEANDTSRLVISLNNRGQEDLTVSDVALSGADAGAFSIVGVAPEGPIESRRAATLTLEFSPDGRGVLQAQATLTSNAENFPTLPLEIIGPGVEEGANQGVGLPDIEAIDDPVRPTEGDAGQAIVRFYNLGRDSLIITRYGIGDTTLFDFAANVAIPGASCSTGGQADCEPDGENVGLFCYSRGNADASDDVCALSVPGANFAGVQLDVLGSGSTAFEIDSNDPDSGTLSIGLQN